MTGKFCRGILGRNGRAEANELKDMSQAIVDISQGGTTSEL